MSPTSAPARSAKKDVIVGVARQSVTDSTAFAWRCSKARMGSELAELVRRYGGVVRSAPAVREAPLDCADVVADF